MPVSDAEIAARARRIFEAEHPGDRRWGTVTGREGKVAIRMEVSEGPGVKRPEILSQQERQPYFERARQELEAEAQQQ